MPNPRLPNCLRRFRDRRVLAVGMGVLLNLAGPGVAEEMGQFRPRSMREIQPTSGFEEQAGELSLDEVEGEPIRAIWEDPAVSTADGQEQSVGRTPNNDLLMKPLAAVHAEGNVTIPEYAITSRIHSRPGRTTSVSQIEEDVQALINSRLFYQVVPRIRTSEDGPVLVFQVTERPILRKVEFKGNKKIKKSHLEGELGLQPGHAYDVATNLECVERIRSMYREKGYRHAMISLEKGSHPDDRDVIFVIEEGPKFRVAEIQFEGNREISGAILKTKLATKKAILWFIGGTFDPEIVANDTIAIKKYYSDLGYFDAEIDHDIRESVEDGRVAVVFKVREGRRFKVRQQTIEGNEVLSKQQLFEEQKLKSGEFFNARYLSQDVTRMKEKYDDLGRLFSRVEPTPRFLEEAGWVDVVYQIEEDEPRRIGAVNIHIRGDHPHTKEDVVRNQVNRFLKPGHLASGKDLRMAKAVLQGHQIWDRSQPAMVDVVRAEQGLYVAQTPIARGQGNLPSGDPVSGAVAELQPIDWDQPASRTTVLSPVFEDHEGNSDFHWAPALESTSGHTTAPAFPNIDSRPAETPGLAIPPQSRRLQAADRQYATADLTSPSALARTSRAPRTQTGRTDRTRGGQDDAGEGYAWTYDIDPSDVFSHDEQSDVIVRGQSPGDQVRGQSIDANGYPIPQNYFGAVSPQGDPFGDAFNRPGEPAFVDVNIDVSEGRTGRLMFGVGVNSDAGVIGQFTLQEDNFDILRPPRSWADIMNGQAWRGRGQSFRLEAMPGSDVSRYVVSFQDPYFLRTDYNLGLSGFYYNRFFQDWTEDRGGGRISLGKLLTRYWSISAAMRLENVEIRNFRLPAPQSILDVKGDNFLSTGQLTLSHDTRDSAFLPTMGHLFEVSYEQGFGEFVYPRVEGSFSQVFTVWERPDGMGKHLLTFRSQLGWTGDDTPVFENFYAGGYSSFRGFAFRGVSPRDTGFRVGGNWMSLGTVEYMLPVTADDNIRMVGFTDFGTVDTEVSMRNFRLSVGLGARLIIPAMGPAPIALDFAFPLMDEPEDNRRVFSFYVGFTR